MCIFVLPDPGIDLKIACAVGKSHKFFCLIIFSFLLSNFFFFFIFVKIPFLHEQKNSYFWFEQKKNSLA